MKIIKTFFNFWYKIKPPEMVRYWKENETQLARIIFSPKNHFLMDIKGEKYPLEGFPRGHILSTSRFNEFSNFSKLKHEIKNQIFNYGWGELENNVEKNVIIKNIKGEKLDYVFSVLEKSKYDMLPYERLVPAVKEIWRAITVLENQAESIHQRERIKRLKECLCFIFQEDDAYRFRVQWLTMFFNPSSLLNRFLKICCVKIDWIKEFNKVLIHLENAEIVNDMKDKIKLLRRILLLLLEDDGLKKLFKKLCEEIDWNKLKLSKSDKYYFRGKYFKVDYKRFDY